MGTTLTSSFCMYKANGNSTLHVRNERGNGFPRLHEENAYMLLVLNLF